MSKFEITQLHQSTLYQLYRMRDRIQLDPDYQRLSDIWTGEKRQLLIDTVLNGFDVPKLYFHRFSTPVVKAGKRYEFAIIDGKQRLETMWNFIEGDFALADEFEYFISPSIKAGGMKYADLGQEYPDLKADFDGFSLTVICIETDEIDIIEEMFSRLNEAATLTAAEKRNAFGGPLPAAIRKIAKSHFFVSLIPFDNKRYRHFDLVAKFLFVEEEGRVVDTKKAYLDKFVQSYEKKLRTSTPACAKKVVATTKEMARVFVQNDSLLRQVGMVMLYYHLFRIALVGDWVGQVTRSKLIAFEKMRDANRTKAEKDITKADYDLIEFDRLAQSPNDASAIKFRLKVILEKAFEISLATDDL